LERASVVPAKANVVIPKPDIYGDPDRLAHIALPVGLERVLVELAQELDLSWLVWRQMRRGYCDSLERNGNAGIHSEGGLRGLVHRGADAG
jgi:hypothetical protein